MAWIGDGGSNSETGVFSSEKVREVMISVDRADFCSGNPYHDSPQTIGYGATISAPHMHAMALEGLLDVIKPDSHILDVGSGSGYLTACFAKLIGPNGTVIGIEHIDELVELSERNLRKHHSKYLDNGQIKIVTGDGRKGYESESPYDAIHVGAAAGELPQALIDQLSVGGRMLISRSEIQVKEFVAIERLQDGQIRKRTLAHVNYVPLTEKEAQLNGRHR
ncbi:Protein-L-isoaspartate O-methyltransferase [Aphelenchoides bicaudatus]|nr:Protein-L-isoaspartate O-methyltransferase [Aphelenchoides bicaudatus]